MFPAGHRLPVVGAGAGRHHPDPVVGAVIDQQVRRAVHRRLVWAGQLSADGRPAVAGEPTGAVFRPRCRCSRRSSPARSGCRCWPRRPRTRLLPRSVDNEVSPRRPPSARRGPLSSAPVAGPPSPENAPVPFPATVVDVPGGHRLPVEGAGAGRQDARSAVRPRRRWPGFPAPSTARLVWAGQLSADCRAAVAGEPEGAGCRPRCVDVSRRSSPGRRRCRCWPRPPGPRLLPRSAMARFPAPSTVTPPRARRARRPVAGPPSPENPEGAGAGHGVRCSRRSSPGRSTCRCWPRPPGPGRWPLVGDDQVSPRPSTARLVLAGQLGRGGRGRRRRRTRRCRFRPRCRCAWRSIGLPVICARAGRDHPDPVIATVGDEPGSPAPSTATAGGPVELGRSSQAAITGIAELAIAGHRVDVPGGHRLAVVGACAGPRPPGSGLPPPVRDYQVSRSDPASPRRCRAAALAAGPPSPSGAAAPCPPAWSARRSCGPYLPHHLGVSGVEAAGAVRDAAQSVLPEPEGHRPCPASGTANTPRDGGDVPSHRRLPDPRHRPGAVPPAPAPPPQAQRRRHQRPARKPRAAGRPSPPDRPLFMTRPSTNVFQADEYGAN